jgi:hypothetical protein
MNKILLLLLFPALLLAEPVFIAPSDTLYENIYTIDGLVMPYSPDDKRKDSDLYLSLKYQNTHVHGYEWQSSPFGANIEVGAMVDKVFVSGFYSLGARSPDYSPYGVRGKLGIWGAGLSFGSIINPVDWFLIIYGASAGYWGSYDMRAYPEDYSKHDAIYVNNSAIGSLFTKALLGNRRIRFETEVRVILGFDFGVQLGAGITFVN